MRDLVLAIAAAAAACKSDPTPAAVPSTPPGDASVRSMDLSPPRDATAPLDVVAADAAVAPSPSPPGCPPSAYRNDGWTIAGVIPFVFPGCPPPELDLDVAYCADCARPCGYQRVTTIEGRALPPRWASARYDEAGRLVSLSTDLPQRFEYDQDGRLRAWFHGVARYAVERNAAGQITRVTKRQPPPDHTAVWEFRYDPVGRVVATVDEFGAVLDLVYDAAGRQVADDDAGDRAVFRYDAAGRLIARGTSWRDTLRYNAAGRLTRIVSGTTRKRLVLTYAGDRLATTVQTGENGDAVTTTTYDYDCSR